MLVEDQNGSLPATTDRRALIDRVASSSQFARSARLRDFLLYVGSESLKDGVPEIHEQEIGVRVFGRSPNYDRSQDNIVRVNATELRKRIDIYFSQGEGIEEPWVFSIPKGGYGPVFQRRAVAELLALPEQIPKMTASLPDPVLSAPDRNLPLSWIGLTAFLILACGFLLWQNRNLRRQDSLWSREPSVAAFWADLAQAAPETDIVLPDASVSMREELLEQEISLNDYLNRDFYSKSHGEALDAGQKRALQTIFNHNLVTLGDFHAAQQVLALAPIAGALHLTLARFYAAESIKRDNLILIGGKKANPWVQLFDEQLNFSLDYGLPKNQAQIVNRHPRQGEQSIYAPIMERNAMTAFSTVAYIPNPSRTGRVMIIAGTDSDATGAAAEFLTSEDGLRKLKLLFGTREKIPYFEVVLKTSRLSGTSFSAEPIAYRVY